MLRTIRPLVLAAVLLAPAAGPLAAAEAGRWRAETTAMGTFVTNGEDISFRAPDPEAGEEMAEALNDADRKAERKAEREQKKGGGDGTKPKG